MLLSEIPLTTLNHFGQPSQLSLDFTGEDDAKKMRFDSKNQQCQADNELLGN